MAGVNNDANDESESNAKKNKRPKVIDGGWGWIVVFSSFMHNCLSDSVSFTFGIFYKDIQASFDDGSAKTQLLNSVFVGVALCTAMKCNPDKAIVKILAGLGSRFDCASKTEIQQVLELGVDPSRIIYANPCKQNSHLTYAKEHCVDLMTFDCEEELIKINKLYESARLVLRFRPGHKYRVNTDLGKKFGCTLHEAKELFFSARKKNLNIVGVSFHVGSNCRDAEAYSTSIKEAREIFNIGQQVGFHLNILDIGGGFPGRDEYRPTIEEDAEIINQYLDEYFPEKEDVKVIAEPGRYLVETSVSAGSCIIGRKISHHIEGAQSVQKVMYNLNDGAFGTFSWVLWESEPFDISPIHHKTELEKYESIVWGPTCDSLDCMVKGMPLPLMEVGEWVLIKYSGSYTFCCSTNFNSMPHPTLYYFCSKDTWSSLPRLIEPLV